MNITDLSFIVQNVIARLHLTHHHVQTDFVMDKWNLRNGNGMIEKSSSTKIELGPSKSIRNLAMSDCQPENILIITCKILLIIPIDWRKINHSREEHQVAG